jgi:hypothetical protein
MDFTYALPGDFPETFLITSLEVLAKGIVDVMLLRPPKVGALNADSHLINNLAETAKSDLELEVRKKVKVAPVAACWDPLSRWRELFRHKWRSHAHNNVLELEATIQCIKHAVRSIGGWGRRLLLISDSQVAIGALMKGRSSAPEILRGCRKAASMALAFGLTYYLRYVPTDRNHADGPSRGGPIGVMKAASPSEPVRFGPWYEHGPFSLGTSLVLPFIPV